MKKEYVVFMRNGNFLSTYEQRDSSVLTYTASFTSEVKDAASLPYHHDAWESQKENLTLLAQALDARPVVIQAEFNLKELDGQEITEAQIVKEREAEQDDEAGFRDFMEMLRGGMEFD